MFNNHLRIKIDSPIFLCAVSLNYLLEVRLELADALLVSTLLPVDSGVVHLVDHHHKMCHTQGASQQRMLPRLPALLETRLELALAR